VAAVAKRQKTKSVVSAAKAKILSSKIIGAAIITDVSLAKKKSKLSPADLIPTFCSNQNNHTGKVCSYEFLKEERDLRYYGITGDSDQYGESPICGNQSSSCCLATKESWKKSFSKKKPALFCCQDCIAITHVDGNWNDGYTPQFFLCKKCSEDVTVGKHTNLISIAVVPFSLNMYSIITCNI
jgi:hypothetical protein